MEKSRSNRWNRIKRQALVAGICVALGMAMVPGSTSAWLSWDDQAVSKGGGKVDKGSSHGDEKPARTR